MSFVAPFGFGTVNTVCPAPVLLAIVNPGSVGDYTVDWNDVVGATGYTLQEDDNPLFTTPAVVYTGAASTFNVVGNPIDTYYYRVMADCSGWSNTESAVVVPWYLNGGIPAANCIAAYTPQGAASLAASYDNNAAPGNGLPDGTYDLALGTAPGWAANTGWQWSTAGLTYLKTGIAGYTYSGCTVLILFSDATEPGANWRHLFGYWDSDTDMFLLCPHRPDNVAGYANCYDVQGWVGKAPVMISGSLAIAGPDGYRNGSFEATNPQAANANTGGDLYLGANHGPVGATEHITCNMQAFALYDIILTPAQIAAVDYAGKRLLPPSTAYIEVTGNDGTAVLGDPTHPFLTINAALSAVSVGSTLRFGLGRFDPMNPYLLKDGIKFDGAGRPNVDGDLSTLTGGTIIDGPFGYDNNGIEIYDLGIDAGLDVCTARYGGVADTACYLCVNDQQVVGKPERTGLIADNIITLCKDATSLVHSFICENATGAVISNITTYFGVHGFVLKATNSACSNITCNGHDMNAIIVRSNDYAPCHDNTLTDIVMNCVAALDTRGLRYNASGNTTLQNVVATNVQANALNIFGADYRPELAGDTVDNCDVVNLTGTLTVTTGGVGTISNCEVNGVPV